MRHRRDEVDEGEIGSEEERRNFESKKKHYERERKLSFSQRETKCENPEEALIE